MLRIQVLGVKEAVAALGKFSGQLDAALKKGLTHAAMVVVKAAKKNIPGSGKGKGKNAAAVPEHLTSRTGFLRNSITFEVSGLEAHIGTNVKYARIHELGGTIRPKGHPFLAIPVGDYDDSPRAHENLRFVPRGARGGLLIEGDSPGGRVQYVLKREVVIPKRPYLQPALDSSQDEIQKRMTEAIEKVLP